MLYQYFRHRGTRYSLQTLVLQPDHMHGSNHGLLLTFTRLYSWNFLFLNTAAVKPVCFNTSASKQWKPDNLCTLKNASQKYPLLCKSPGQIPTHRYDAERDITALFVLHVPTSPTKGVTKSGFVLLQFPFDLSVVC